MSVNASALFAFSRPLPAPFENANRRQAVASQYTTGNTQATLSPSLIKAVHAYMDCAAGAGKGGVGTASDRIAAEYRSSVEDTYHIVAYKPGDGQISAGIYNTATETIAQYRLTTSGNDGAAIHMALMPVYSQDTEFREAYERYKAHIDSGYPGMDEATRAMALMCDNAYRRIVDETCSAHVKLGIEKSGNVTRITNPHISAGRYAPDSVLCGEFVILAHTARTAVIKPAAAIRIEDFIGKYRLDPNRCFSAWEQALIPTVPEWYILPQQVVSICRHAQMTTGKNKPMRNFLLRGPAGTGKTEGARAIAAGLGLPYMKFTCSANTEIYDLIGQVFPDTTAFDLGSGSLDEERKALSGMGGMSFDNVAKLMGLPDIDDVSYDPAGVYAELTGMENAGASPQDCIRLIMERVTDKLRALCRTDGQDSGPAYTYVETDFIRALKHGYLIEVQEPAVIMQPGVLVGLNSLLEQGGSITLPTGEIINRHPDAVVVITTNTSYEGCRALNQSVVDRMSLVQDIELPAPEVMAARAMSVTGCSDEYMVSKMVTVIDKMSAFMRQSGITDGSCGMRSLIDWILSTEVTGNPYASALCTIISKASADEEDRASLIEAALSPYFTEAA